MVSIVEYITSCCISTLCSAGIVLSIILYGYNFVTFETAAALITLMAIIIIVHQLILKPLVEEKERADDRRTYEY